MLGHLWGPRELRESSKAIFSYIFDSFRRPAGSRFGSQTAPFKVFCADPFLRTLNLSDNYLCDEGATAVGRLLEHNTTLTALDLSDNNMGWASEMVLQGVALNPHMRRIGLKGNKINDSIAHSVFDAICRANMRPPAT